jgi:hypothetical protein
MSRMLCVLASLLLLFGSSLFGQNGSGQPAQIPSSQRALLKAFGENVRVNGTTISDVTTVFAGDRIETGADSAASLVLSGRMLSLNQNSSAIFRDGSLVRSGQNVSTSSGISAAVVTSSPTKPCPVSPDKPGKGPKCPK